MERNPVNPEPVDSSIFAKPLVSLTRLCCRYPVTVVVLSLFLAGISTFYSWERLGFKMSRLDLINPNSGFNRLWLDYIDEFGNSDEIIAVVEGKGNAEITPVLEALSKRIESYPEHFQGVLHGVDISRIKLKGLHYVPVKELAIIDGFVKETTQITADHWDRLCVGPMLDGMATRLETARDPETLIRTLKELDSFSGSLEKAYALTPSYGSPWPQMQLQGTAQMPDVVAACSQNNTSYFLFPTQTGVMGFVLLKLAKVDTTEMAQGTDSIEKLKTLVAETKEKFPGIKIGLTGMPIMENDEMRLSNDAMNKATILAFVGVTLIFMAGYGSLWHPSLTMVVFTVAFGWTLGYITLAVGHLNILSVAFGAMLIGIGADFSIHYISRYLMFRKAGLSTEDALVRAIEIVGPGILTGAMTTAIAFYAAAFTEFTGISELGIISGGGIILCVLATFTVLPSLIRIFDAKKKYRVLPEPIDLRAMVFPVIRFPGTTLLLSLAGAVFLFMGLSNVWYDHNLLNLQPDGLESVELERKLLSMEADGGGKNVWYALSIADTQDELLRRKKEFEEKYPELKVEEIVSWFPAADQEKIPIIQSLAKHLENLPERPPELPVTPPDRLGASIQRLQELFMNPASPVRMMMQQMNGVTLPVSVGDLSASLQEIPRRLAGVRESLRSLSQSDYDSRTVRYQSAVAGDLLSRLRTLKSMAVVEPPTIADLPESLVSRFVGKGGKQLMRIYSSANIWNMDELEAFVKAVRSIDPKATGSPLQTYEASRQMLQGYIVSGIYALIAITIFLFIDFRNIRDVCLSLLPLFIGVGMMFGILGWMNVPLNPANMIVLPLILGLGIDSCVHFVHSYRMRQGRFELCSSTTTSIIITGLTSIIGFGAMMIASHKGLQSLGRVLTIGVTTCMFTSIVMLPSLLIWWTRNEKKAVDETEFPESAVDSWEEMICPIGDYNVFAAPEVESRHESSSTELRVSTPPFKPKRLTRRDLV